MADKPDFAIYKSSHQDVLDAWANASSARDAYNLRMKKQLAAWGFPKGTEIEVTNSAWVTCGLLGVHWSRRDIPVGWRKDGRNSRIVPYAREKQLSAEFKALRKVPDIRRDLIDFGMPHHEFTGLYVTTYAIRSVDSEIWVKWHGVDPAASEQWWTRVKLSDYYAMVEAGNDPFAADEVEND